MGQQTELFDLVRSLSKADKRFFRLFSEGVGGKGSKQYLQLFDVLEEMDSYSEEHLRARVEGSGLENHLSTNKNRLFNQILRSQRVQRSGRSTESTIRSLIEEIEILHQKGLRRSCEKRIRKALKLAQSYEKENLVLELLSWKWKITQSDPIRKQSAAISTQLDEINDCRQRLARQVELKYLYEQIRILNRLDPRARSEEFRSRYQNVVSSSILQSPPSEERFLESVFYYLIWGTYEFVHANYGEASQYLRHLVEVWNKNTGQIEELADLYLQTLHTFLTCLLMGKSGFPEFDSTVRSLRNTIRSESLSNINFEWICYHHELSYALNFRSAEETAALIQQVDSWIQNVGSALNLTRLLSFYYNFTVFYFAVGNFSTANQWVRRILSLPEGGERQDIRDFARLFQAFFQYQLGNFDVNEYLVRSTYRYMTRNKRYHPFERCMMKMIQQSLQAVTEEDHRRIALEFQQNLDEIWEQDAAKAIPGLDEMYYWTLAKAQGMTLREMFEQHRTHNKKVAQGTEEE